MEFLQRIFPLRGSNDPRAGEFVRFISVSNANPWPGTHHWLTRGELHSADRTDIAGLGFDDAGSDLYFTPHGFARRDMRVTKEDAVDLLDVCWVELDDDDIPPSRFKPAPSIAVQTSPGRYHLYWLLETPLPKATVEQINRRLVYGNGIRKDPSGWGLVKLLRVPGSVSYKRSKPFPVAIDAAEIHLDRVYREADFENLPILSEIASEHSVPPPPQEDTLPTADDVRNRYGITKELDDILGRRYPDRSQALWRAYNICFRQGMSDVDAYALIRHTPNDKFTEWRYNGPEGLWKDLRKGFHMAQVPEDSPILRKLDEVAFQKGVPAEIKRRKLAQLIAADMSQLGRIFFDDTRRDAMFYDGHRVITMDPKDRRWKAFLNLNYHVADGDPGYTAINANLYAIATKDGERVSPHTSTYWDRNRKLLYVYNGGGVVYRLDGDQIEAVDNGTDGVLFRDLTFGEPFVQEPSVDPDKTPSLVDTIFSLPNYVNDPTHHTREQAVALMRVWFYSLFFGEQLDARPHLVVVGPTSSGKSLVFQAMSELLYGEGATVSTIPKDRDQFETVVSNADKVFFDNVDTPNNWLMDALAETATGIQFTRRVYYTTNESVTYTVKCFLGLTTRDEWFSRADIATRLLVLHVGRRQTQMSPTALLDRVRTNRSALWHEAMVDLNRIIRQLKTQKVGEHRIRMAGYADFLEAVCKALDLNARGLIDVISGTQVASALSHSVIWECLDAWLNHQDRTTNEHVNNGQWVATNRLHQELSLRADALGCGKEYHRRVPSARSLSHQLRELVPDIRNVIEVEFDQAGGRNRYCFTKRIAEPEPMAAD